MKEQRLIDANRLEDTWNQFLSMIDNVEAQPTVNSVKQTASIAIEPTIGNTVIYVCSHCGQYINIKDNFCCNCGCQFTNIDIPI